MWVNAIGRCHEKKVLSDNRKGNQAKDTGMGLHDNLTRDTLWESAIGTH